jgi:hypothetical protein
MPQKTTWQRRGNSIGRGEDTVNWSGLVTLEKERGMHSVEALASTNKGKNEGSYDCIFDIGCWLPGGTTNQTARLPELRKVVFGVQTMSTIKTTTLFRPKPIRFQNSIL